MREKRRVKKDNMNIKENKVHKKYSVEGGLMSKLKIAKPSVKLLMPILIVVILLAVIITALFSNLQNINKNIDPEIARTMEYKKVKEGDEAIQGTQYVEFDAFFLRDTDGNNEAEPYRGTCREIGSEDTLYMELKVKTNGTLQNGKIEINGDKNYYLQTAIVKDNEIKANSITENATEILFNDIRSGTQKLLTATVRSGDYTASSRKSEAIGNNVKNYSKENTIVFTGDHVSSEGVKTPIRKEVKFNVDWHGTTGAQITNVYQTNKLETAIDNEKGELNLDFVVSTQETQKQLILKNNEVEGIIPQLSGYSPIRVQLLNSNATLSYDKSARKFTIRKVSVLNEESGNVSNSLSTSNQYNVRVTYPLDAYNALGADTVEIKIPIETYYEGYNNTNNGFKNPYVSDKAEATIVATYRNPQGERAIFNVYVGDYAYKPYGRYMVSKNKPLRIYNGISEKETNDIYTVKWEAYTGTTGKSNGIIMKETENESKQVSDEFIITDANSISMESLTNNIGIYFSSPVNMLGEDGWIKIYDDETNSLIATFTKENWSKYSENNPYRYSEPIKHIRVETSATNADASMSVYNIKELDDAIIIQSFAKDEFDKLQYIKSTLAGYVDGEHINTDIENAKYEEPISVANVKVSKTDLSTQVTENSYKIYIEPETNEEYNESKWVNGAFLLKLPQDIIDIEINNVSTGNSRVSATYSQYEEDGIQYIKVDTENEKEEVYSITVDCNITPNPTIETKTETIELYASNEYNTNYYYKQEDSYDVNNNLNVNEYVNKTSTNIQLISPATLITSQIAREYDGTGSETIAPKIANVSKGQNTAKVVINVKNNYSNTVERVKIVGKIPTSGNTYTINGHDMGSNFDTTMTEAGIQLPEGFEQKGVKVYYSTYEDGDKDNIDEWEETPNFDEVKSFMIDFQDVKLEVNEEFEISYEINIPSSLNYNQVSYSHHAIYFSLQTNSGLYPTSTEPNKLGFRIAKLYDLELTKYHKGIDNKIVQGATYSIQEEGEEAKTRVTNENGKITLNDLYAEKTYTIKEVKSPSEYALNEDEVKFTTKEENGQLTLKMLSENTKGNRIVQENGRDKVEIDVEDEVLAKLKIIKTQKDTTNKLKNVRYKLTGRGMPSTGRILVTNIDGEINISGLFIGEQYTLEEIKAEGYYLAEPIQFTITANGNGNYTEEISGDTVKEHSISKANEIPTLTIEIANEKIPTYNLVINKVVKDEQTPIAGAKFALYKDGERIATYITDAEGKININGLYEYVEAKKVKQTYVLKEVGAPEGYAKVEDITFYASMQEGVLKLTIEGGTIKEQHTVAKEDTIQGEAVQENTITITVEDSPTFVLTKEDGKTKEVLPGVKFAIYNYKTGEPATDAKGQIIGEKQRINGKYYYVVTTNEQGKITANLPQGLYKAVEIETYEEYELGTEEERTDYFGIGESQEEVIEYQASLLSTISGITYRKIISTLDKGFLAVAEFYKDIELTNGQKITNTGNFDTVLIKYNANKKIEWTRVIGGKGYDYINDIIQLPDGSYIAGGQVGSSNVIINEDGTIIEDDSKYVGNNCYAILSKYKMNGDVEWSKTIGSNYTYDSISSIELTNDEGYIIGGTFGTGNMNIKVGDERRPISGSDGKLIKFNKDDKVDWIQSIGEKDGEYFKIEDIQQTEDEGYIIAGSFSEETLTLPKGQVIKNEYTSIDEGYVSYNYYDAVIIKYKANKEIEWINQVGGRGNQNCTDIFQTADGGYIVGIQGDYIITLSNDEELKKSGIIKYRENGEIEYVNSTSSISSVEKTSDDGYIICGGIFHFIEKYSIDNVLEWKLNTDISYVTEIDKNQYIGVYIANMYEIGEKVTKPKIPDSHQVTVDNNLKEFKITTEVKVVDGKKGGSILGEGSTLDNPYETVQYGKESIKPITMTPHQDYSISKITINEKEVEFNVEKDGTYTLPQFKNVTENKHIVVTYILTSEKEPEVIVHHYKKDTQERVAVDEIYKGKVGEPYRTEPKTDLEDYELAKDENGEFLTPHNASGLYQEGTQEVIYEYEERKIPLTVHHYIEGTTSKVPMPDGTLAEDVKDEGKEGTQYTTNAIIPDKKYELALTPDNYIGTYQKPEVEVTYYYRGKQSPGVVVHHIDTDTKEEVAKDEVIPQVGTARYGDSYTTNVARDILDTYEFASKTPNWEGEMTEEKIEVTYEYHIKYNMQITKRKENTTDTIQGVGFNLKGEGLSPEGVNYITDENGNINLQGLVAGVEYTIYETYTPNNYVLNEEPIKFKVTRTKEGILELQEQEEGHRIKNVKIDEVQQGIVPQITVDIENTPKYELNIVKYKKGTNDKVSNVTFNIKGEGLVSEGVNYTTDNNGTIKISNLMPEKEYEIKEIKTNIDYMPSNQIVRFSTHLENGVLTAQELTEEIARKIEVTQVAEGTFPQVEVQIDNEPKYAIQITKYEKGTNNTIPKVKFVVTGKEMGETGRTYITDDNGIITIPKLEQGETYTIKEVYAKGYYLNAKEFTVRVDRIGEDLQIQYNGGETKGNPIILQEDNKPPVVQINLENENIPKYSLQLTKVGEEAENLLTGAKFEITGEGRELNAEKKYVTSESGIITIDNLYVNEEYTLTETQAPTGYKLSETPVKFKATQTDGNWNLQLTEGQFYGETQIEGSTIKVKWQDETLFKLEKRDAETHELLQGAKYTIKDMNGNYAKDIAGNEIGKEEEINGQQKKVLTTDEQGSLTAEIQPGTYQVEEVEAPYGYELPDETTQYFGIDQAGSFDQKLKSIWANDIVAISSSARGAWDYYCGRNYDIDQVVSTVDGGFLVTLISDKNVNEIEIDSQVFGLPRDANSYSSYYIIKFSQDKKIEWANYVGMKKDSKSKIAEIIDGEYVLIGNTSNDIRFNDTDEPTKMTSNSGATIIKYNTHGKRDSVNFLGEGNVELYAISSTVDGGYIIGGKITSGELVLEGHTLEQGNILIKYNRDNKVENACNLELDIKSIVTALDGGYIIGGTQSSIVKLKSDLTKEWSDKIENVNGNNCTEGVITSIEQTEDEGIIAGGNYDKFAFVVKYNSEGTIEWSRQIGSGKKNSEVRVIQAFDGDFLATFEGYIVKYDSKGEEVYVNDDFTSGYTENIIIEIAKTHTGTYITGAKHQEGLIEYKDQIATEEYIKSNERYYDSGTCVLATEDGGFITWSKGYTGFTKYDINGKEENNYYGSSIGQIIELSSGNYISAYNDNDTYGNIHILNIEMEKSVNKPQWEKEIIGDATSNSIAKTSDGGFVIGGSLFGETLALDNGKSIKKPKGQEGVGLIIKYKQTSEGNYEVDWSNTIEKYGETGNEVRILCIDGTSDGGCIAGGVYMDNDLNIGQGLLVKYNKEGEQEWIKNIEMNNEDFVKYCFITHVSECSEGEYIVGGFLDENYMVLDGNENVIILKYKENVQDLNNRSIDLQWKRFTLGETISSDEIYLGNSHEYASIHDEYSSTFVPTLYFTEDGGVVECDSNGNVVKYDSNGKKETIYKNATDDIFAYVVQTKCGKYFIINQNYKHEKIELAPITDGNTVIPQTQRITFEDTKKEYIIDTKVEGGGGSVLGQDQEIYEKVKYKGTSIRDITATPEQGYAVESITVNGQEVLFKGGENVPVTLDKFTNMSEDKHVVVKFTANPAEVVVHHYLDGTEGNEGGPTPVAEDDYIYGQTGKHYETHEKDLDKYVVVEERKPDKPSGEMTEGTTEVTYYYKPRDAKVIVHHYEYGTDVEGQELVTVAQDETINGKVDETYNTHYKTEQELDGNYRVVEAEIPGNSNGKMTRNQIEVTYYYEKIKKGKVTVHHYIEYSEEPVDPENPEDVLEGEVGTHYDTHPRENLEEYELVTDSMPSNAQGNYEEEQKEVTYYYRLKETKVIVHHYKDGTGTEEVPLQQISPDETIKGRIKDSYKTAPKEGIGNYEVIREEEKWPTNAEGNMEKDTIEVTYYYRLKQANIVENTLTKEGTEKMVLEDEKVQYTITYKAEIKDYTGNAKITLIDELPYNIDLSKSNIMEGTYNELEKTITWEIEIDNLDAYGDKSEYIEVSRKIELVFTNMDYTQKTFTNKAKGTLELLDVEQKVEIPEATKETESDFKTSVLATKYWEHGENKFKKPSKIEVQLKKGGEVVNTQILTEENKAYGDETIWEYEFTDLEKYDAEGNEIEYTIEEQAVEGEDLSYYQKEIDSEDGIIRNTFNGPVITISKSSTTEHELDYVVENEKITYTITVTNSGQMAKEVLVKDTIPQGTTFVAGSIKVGNVPIEEYEGEAIQGNKENTQTQLEQGIKLNMEPQESINISFEVQVQDLENGQYIENVATINKSPDDPESQDEPSNKVLNLYSETTITSQKYAVTERELDYVIEGETITYNIMVINEGQIGKEVVVSDTIPQGTTFVEGSIKLNGQPLYNDADKTIPKTQEDLKNGITIYAEPSKGAVGGMQNYKILSFEVTVDFAREEFTIQNTATVDDTPTEQIEIPYKLEGKVTSGIEKDGTDIITSKDEEINYTIKYNAQVRKYEGNAIVTIVDTLPYALDVDKMKKLATEGGINTEDSNTDWLKEFLQEGEYKEKLVEGSSDGAKTYTITWTQTIENIDTLGKEEARDITINKNIKVIFKDVDIKEKSLTNTVKGKIELQATEQTIETEPATHETKANYIKDVKVTKKWEHGENIYERPKSVILQVKKGDQVIESYKVTEQDNWTHTFINLPKYDEETGEEIYYTVDEQEVEGESLKYYKKR